MAQAANEPTAPAAEAHPTPFVRGCSVHGELVSIRAHLTTASIACLGLRTEDGDAIASVLCDITRRVERLCEDQAAELSAIASAERKKASASPTREREAQIEADIARVASGNPSPWNIVCAMEDPVADIIDFTRAINIVGCDLEQPYQGAICRLSRSVEASIKQVEELRGQLFYALHPRRGEPGFPPVDEEAEGDAA